MVVIVGFPQEEEKRMRDEYIAYQQQELEKQASRKDELNKLEVVTKKRVAKDNKGSHYIYCCLCYEIRGAISKKLM